MDVLEPATVPNMSFGEVSIRGRILACHEKCCVVCRMYMYCLPRESYVEKKVGASTCVVLEDSSTRLTFPSNFTIFTDRPLWVCANTPTEVCAIVVA